MRPDVARDKSAAVGANPAFQWGKSGCGGGRSVQPQHASSGAAPHDVASATTSVSRWSLPPSHGTFLVLVFSKSSLSPTKKVFSNSLLSQGHFHSSSFSLVEKTFQIRFFLSGVPTDSKLISLRQPEGELDVLNSLAILEVFLPFSFPLPSTSEKEQEQKLQCFSQSKIAK